MAEAAGLVMGAISMASLFKTCIECVEYVEAGKDMSRDLEATFALLDLQKCRFLLFGDKSGILEPTSSNKRVRYLDDEKYRPFIENALNNIFLMFRDSRTLEDRYGVRDHTSPSSDNGDPKIVPLRRRGTDFKRNLNHRVGERYSALIKCLAEKAKAEKIEVGDVEAYAAKIAQDQKAATFLAKARWAVHDRSKFRDLVDVLAKMIDSLVIFISMERQIEDSILEEVRAIRNLDRLTVISVACNRAHPAIARAAGDVIEVVSTPDLSEEQMEEKISKQAVVLADEFWTDEGALAKAPAATSNALGRPSGGGSDERALVRVPQEDTLVQVWKGLPSQHITRIFFVAHGCENLDRQTAPIIPFINEGDLRSLTDDDFQPQRGALSILGIRLAEACSTVFYHTMPKPNDGFKYLYVAPTLPHLEMAIAIAQKSHQTPLIRADYRLLTKKPDNIDTCLENAAAVLAERELACYESHGARHPRGPWTPLLKYFDHPYFDRVSAMLIPEFDGPLPWHDEFSSFGLREIFAEMSDDTHGDVIVIADWNRIQSVLKSAATVEIHDRKLRKESVTQLTRLPTRPETPDVQFWRAQFFLNVGRR
ncbi:prion-inhibition and propagation-domain-containing protein [Apodospora peruviana]|uniref:Prion-inhibition and propagation-domain-containing protein n=1 Tax=Apodospora peruviana TaxID=516989 RepID=A0AAE0HWK5_9PEZI|nr:prion-inhibition and propagation-domain-containing protein [Apodospora peruviana]